jgi:hypothetical protein
LEAAGEQLADRVHDIVVKAAAVVATEEDPMRRAAASGRACMESVAMTLSLLRAASSAAGNSKAS